MGGMLPNAAIAAGAGPMLRTVPVRLLHLVFIDADADYRIYLSSQINPD